ncbi:MBOAT, membrane-bound O-acyltransferase family [Rhizoctonia solani]|uniref:MBOAT, membrane-bound O-acyltransferase family n=1 Tax=Rhizoctonia solani TaxID=456999 RepID=A0A8H7H731_9AGAM|nr:MBOAT, membrane-bound O-acyltransferase family [Rhizoctonia solani]
MTIPIDSSPRIPTMNLTSTAPVISKSGSDIQTQDGTIHVRPYRQANSKQLRAVITFTPRSSAFEASGSDPFRGFYSLFWISMVLLLLRTYVNNFFQNGYPLSMVFATLFTRDAKTLAISDAVLVSSTFICVPFVKALQKGHIRYYYTGQTILHVYQVITLALAIQWTFNREWPWVQSGFFTLHTLVMLMKTYSYVATNGYLSDLARKRALTEDQLRKSTESVGGYEVALAEAKEAAPQSPGTQTVTPIGTPLSDKEAILDQVKLRQRLNSAEQVKKDNTIAPPKTSSYLPMGDTPEIPPHPLVHHPSSNIAVLAQSLTEMDLELTSTGKNRVQFPNNISYANFLDFQMVPTLCYELEYPRTERIRPLYIFEKTVATFGTFTLLYTITEHYIIPLTPTSDQSFARSMLDLALPFMLSYLILFYIIFECICNGFAELSCFGDREFYQDWWNSTSFDEYARKWNKPVHAFLLRHVYQASLSSKRVSKLSATFFTFLLSAVFHELVMAVVTKKIRMYLFGLQLPTPKDGGTKEDKPTIHENIYTIPNALTVSRIIACPVLGWAILEGKYGFATGLLLYAGITDWIDGYLARKWNMRTVIGTILDPAADKTLMTTLTVTLAMKGLLPGLAVIILGRDVLLSISAFYYRYISLPPPKTFERYWDFSIPSAEVRPTQISKYNTFLQLSLMGVTTIAPIIPLDLSMQLSALQLTVAATTIWSGLSYVFSKDAVKIISQHRPPKP